MTNLAPARRAAAFALVLAAAAPPAFGSVPGGETAASEPLLLASSCASGLGAEIDSLSFTSRDERPAPTAAALETLREKAERAFEAAADNLCATGQIAPDLLHPFNRLLVQSGSGASETAVYTDEETHGADTLIFQWVFVEEKLALPDQADIEMGILCWADPEAAGCEERMP